MPDIDSDSCLNIDRGVWKVLYPFRFKCQSNLTEAGDTLFTHTSFVKKELLLKELTWNPSLENITISPQVTYYSGKVQLDCKHQL